MRSSLMLLILVGAICVDPQNDQVFDWPFYPEHNFNTYSGFVDLYEGKQLIHYIFMESPETPENKPLIVWFGGGPGCSCMLSLISEIGPYVREKFSDNNVFTENEYSLHKLGNILYLDIPAGVGYSILNDPDYEWSDTNTGKDSYEAIRVWLNAFQLYQDTELWIGGESYSGMYVPCTAEVIVQKNIENPHNKINLKGILVGNGVLVNDDNFFDKWNREYMVKRHFYDVATSNILSVHCINDPNSVSCQKAIERTQIIGQNLNPYDVYGYCYGDSTVENSKQRKFKTIGDSDEAPCIDIGPLNNFFDNKNVRAKLHITDEISWDACNMDVFYNFNRDKNSHTLMKYLYENDVRILQYSGNTDDIVSLDYTYASLNKIEGIEQLSRTAFANSDKQLAGWVRSRTFSSL